MQRKLTVSQLNQYIGGVFDDECVLHDVTVCGEVFEYRQAGATSFLTLREGDCVLSCVCFRGTGNVAVGMNVEALGSVGFYAKTGRVSFLVEEIRPSGEGVLALEFQKLKEKLRREGLFENRPPLPSVIRKIAVVTSEGGAVIHDILSVVRTKNPSLDVCVCDVRVQGRESAGEIVSVLRLLGSSRLGIDAVVIARGGGSAYDLQAYNTEEVARAVADCPLPIVSAVGHETDYTLCDLCASARAGTPSIAADLVASPGAEKAAQVRSLLLRMEAGLSRKFLRLRSRAAVRAAAVVSCGENLVRSKTEKTTRLLESAFRRLENLLSARRQKVALLAAVLDQSSPLKTLSRGYAKIVKNGEEVASSRDLTRGDEISIVMRDGKVKAEVTGG